MWPCIVTNFFVIKPTRCTNLTKLLCHETLHISDSSSVHQDGTAVPSWSCSKAVYEPVWYIPLLRVQWISSWWWTDELSEIYRVSWQNKFVKLVHIVGFITKENITGKFVVVYTGACMRFLYWARLMPSTPLHCPSHNILSPMPRSLNLCLQLKLSITIL